MRDPDSNTRPKTPDFSRERALLAEGAQLVAGVDEAGRGPLAGPVVAAAVCLSRNAIPAGLNDSKKLTKERREALFADIMAEAHVSVAVAPPEVIDCRNIRGATLWAMTRAVAGLPLTPDHVLVDGRDIPSGLGLSATAVIGGDGACLSIAAASIIAKVVRDRMCPIMDLDCPGYAFARHKGYGTEAHLEALTGLGPSAHHRRSFAPVARFFEKALV